MAGLPSQAVDNPIQVCELVPAIVGRLPAILAEVRELLAEQQLDYSAFLAEGIEEVLGAAEGFVARLIGLVDRDSSTMAPQLASSAEQALFEEIGRIHYQQQRDLTPLLAAYRTGATVAWRHVADTALQLNVPAEAFAGLATVVFAAVEQLSSASSRGYVRAQTGEGHAREQLRKELAEVLLSGRSDPAAVRAAAARAKWYLPRQVAVVLINRSNQAGRGLLNHLDDSCLRLWRPRTLVLIVPDPNGPGQRKRLATVLRGTGAVVGTTVPLERLPASVGFVELAMRLQQRQILTDDPLFVDEHLDAIMVHRDERLLTTLRCQCLAPLASLPASTRARLAETLRSWLMNMGNRKAVAEELHVHPQTVRYRLGQLRALFGSALDELATRAALLLALAWGPAAASATHSHWVAPDAG
jgi:PucR-like helix-turn-helix protein